MTQATFQHKDKQPSDKSDAREFSEGEKKKKWKEECREIKRAQLMGVERGGGWGGIRLFFFLFLEELSMLVCFFYFLLH